MDKDFQLHIPSDAEVNTPYGARILDPEEFDVLFGDVHGTGLSYEEKIHHRNKKKAAEAAQKAQMEGRPAPQIDITQRSSGKSTANLPAANVKRGRLEGPGTPRQQREYGIDPVPSDIVQAIRNAGEVTAGDRILSFVGGLLGGSRTADERARTRQNRLIQSYQAQQMEYKNRVEAQQRRREQDPSSEYNRNAREAMRNYIKMIPGLEDMKVPDTAIASDFGFFKPIFDYTMKKQAQATEYELKREFEEDKQQHDFDLQDARQEDRLEFEDKRAANRLQNTQAWAAGLKGAAGLAADGSRINVGADVGVLPQDASLASMKTTFDSWKDRMTTPAGKAAAAQLQHYFDNPESWEELDSSSRNKIITEFNNTAKMAVDKGDEDKERRVGGYVQDPARPTLRLGPSEAPKMRAKLGAAKSIMDLADQYIAALNKLSPTERAAFAAAKSLSGYPGSNNFNAAAQIAERLSTLVREFEATGVPSEAEMKRAYEIIGDLRNPLAALQSPMVAKNFRNAFKLASDSLADKYHLIPASQAKKKKQGASKSKPQSKEMIKVRVRYKDGSPTKVHKIPKSMLAKAQKDDRFTVEVVK